MVYNGKHNFLFVHIQKNAGAAITQALLKVPGSEFIAPSHLRLQDLTFSTLKKPFVFAVIRNPWSRLVSWYEMMLRKGVHNDFSRYLLFNQEQPETYCSFSKFIYKTEILYESTTAEHAKIGANKTAEVLWNPRTYVKSLGFNQVDYLVDTEGVINCDMYVSFESLRSDWEKLKSRLNLYEDLSLTLENTNPRSVDYRSYYQNSEDIAWVADLYRRDIETFRYSFDS